MIYKSPLCSCTVCREIKSAKGIHSHHIAAHGTTKEKIKMIGINGSRNYNVHKQKEAATLRETAYNSSPAVCKQCNSPLPYTKRINIFCNHRCAARYTNHIRDKEKIYKTISEKNKLSNKKAPYTKISQCKICKKWSSGRKVTCNNHYCKHLNLKGRIGGFRKNSTKVLRSIYNDQQMDSGAELAFAKLLDLHNIKWLKNSSQFFEFTYPDNKSGKYFPDFYLPDYNSWVEIKGKKYYREHDELRWASVPNLEIIWAHDIKLPAVCTGIEPV